MSDVASELKQALDQLPPPSATLLEQLVRDALALVRQRNPMPTSDPLRLPHWYGNELPARQEHHHL